MKEDVQQTCIAVVFVFACVVVRGVVDVLLVALVLVALVLVAIVVLVLVVLVLLSFLLPLPLLSLSVVLPVAVPLHLVLPSTLHRMPTSLSALG